MRTLAFAINFWSRGEMEGLFLRHEGYCGALGAFLATLQSKAEDEEARQQAGAGQAVAGDAARSPAARGGGGGYGDDSDDDGHF